MTALADPIPEPQFLLDAWSSWLLGERCLSQQTEYIYTWRVGYLLRDAGKHPLEITAIDLRAHMQAHCRAPNTKAAALRAFRSFFRYLVTEGFRTDNPATLIRHPKIPKTLPRYLTADEAAAIDEAAAGEDIGLHALCRLFLYEGMRASEGVRLAWRDPTPFEDPDRLCSGVVDLRSGWIRVRGKGSRERELPIVPKVRETLSLLRKYKRHDVWLFPRKPNAARPGQENLPLSVGCAQIAVKRWASTAGIDPARVSLHRLRHTFATHYLAGGADISYVQSALGHANVATTLIYARTRPEDLKRTMRRVNY